MHAEGSSVRKGLLATWARTRERKVAIRQSDGATTRPVYALIFLVAMLLRKADEGKTAPAVHAYEITRAAAGAGKSGSGSGGGAGAKGHVCRCIV